MNRQISIDFYRIHTWAAFYRSLKEQTELPAYFGNNLDALWDWITGEAELPMNIKLTNVSEFQQKKFQQLFQLMKDAENELNNEFSFELVLRSDLEDDG